MLMAKFVTPLVAVLLLVSEPLTAKAFEFLKIERGKAHDRGGNGRGGDSLGTRAVTDAPDSSCLQVSVAGLGLTTF